MVDRIKKHKPVSLGTFKNEEGIELIKQFDNYIKLCNRNKNSNKFSSRLGFIRNAIKKELKGKILDNEFIVLPKPYYFNINELKEEGIVKATSVKPIKELEKSFILFNVPNNLDLWNEEFNSYCFEDNFNLHRGYHVKHDEIEEDLVFSYDSETEEVEIAISNDRDIYFTSKQSEEKDKLIIEKKIYLPNLNIYLPVDNNGLEMYSYHDYKHYILEKEDSAEEREEIMKKIEKYVEERGKKLTEKYVEELRKEQAEEFCKKQ